MLLYFHIYIYNIKHDTILLCFIQPIRRIRCMLILAGCAAKESELVSNGFLPSTRKREKNPKKNNPPFFGGGKTWGKKNTFKHITKKTTL